MPAKRLAIILGVVLLAAALSVLVGAQLADAAGWFALPVVLAVTLIWRISGQRRK